MRAATLFALALAAAGCANGPSLVVVDVSADAPLENVATLSVLASAGGKQSSFTITPPSGALSFDTTQSFGIDLPKGMTGTISVSVDALDSMNNTLASGSASAPIKQGQRVDLALTLAVVGATGTDLGSPPDMASGGDLALPSTAPMLTADHAQQMFGSVTVGKTSNPVNVKITNSGDETSGALMFATSGANVDQFTITNGCSGTLAPNASCNVTVQFAPTTAAMATAHFDVSGSPGGSVGVDVSGTGTPPGTLTITANAPANGNCGAAIVGQTSATTATYTVTNVGTGITGTMAVATGDPQFTATGCSGTLDANASCTLSVTFKPTGSGTISSSVQVQATPGGVAPANVQGTGLKPAAFKITSPPGFDFGSAARNSAGNVLTFTATNTGDVTSNALAHAGASGGNAASSFILITANDGCYMQTVAPNGTCMFQIELKPLQSGQLGTTLQLKDSTTGSVLGMANVTGTGTPIWQQETLPPPSGATAVPPLTTVFGVPNDGSHVYAAAGETYYERDATGTWTAYPINSMNVTPGQVNQGAAVATNSVFLATDVGIESSTAPTSWSVRQGAMSGIFAFSKTDGWAVDGTNSYRLTASGWAMDSAVAAGTLWGSNDSDVWAGGGTTVTVSGVVNYIAYVLHRDSSGTWTPQTFGTMCHNCIGSVTPYVQGVYGFGAPATTVFATTRPVAPEMWTSSTGWVALANVPLGMAGSGKQCAGVWGTSPTSVWFACTAGMFRYTGAGTWDTTSPSGVLGFTSVWGSSGIDVYAVGQDSDNAGYVWHYF